MPRAVRYQEYGGLDVLHVEEVDKPRAGAGQVLVRMIASSINPGEVMIREGAMAEQAPSDFPSGQGSDLAGVVDSVGDDVTTWSAGDEVIGWTDERAAQADYVVVPQNQLIEKPESVTWEQGGSLYVAGCTAQALLDASGARSGETVLVAGASGGVGSILVQLLRRQEVRVLGVAGPDNDDWLTSKGVEPVNYGDDLEARVRSAATSGLDAVLDAHGGGYVDLAIRLGVPRERIVTIADFDTDEEGVRVVIGYQSASAEMLADLAGLIADGTLDIPIAAVYPLDEVRDAYQHLADRHPRGKIVLSTQ